ncbi:hypothetical protein BH10CYA1_BH10CYA1_28400 [soil metagenome]
MSDIYCLSASLGSILHFNTIKYSNSNVRQQDSATLVGLAQVCLNWFGPYQPPKTSAITYIYGPGLLEN